MLGIYGEVRVHRLRSPWHVCCHALRRGLLWRVNISNWRSCLWKEDVGKIKGTQYVELYLGNNHAKMRREGCLLLLYANLPYLPFVECTITSQTDLEWIMRSHIKETPSILHIGFSLVVMRTTPQPAITSSVALEESFQSLKKNSSRLAFNVKVLTKMPVVWKGRTVAQEA